MDEMGKRLLDLKKLKKLNAERTRGKWCARTTRMYDDDEGDQYTSTVGPVTKKEHWNTDSGYPGYGMSEVDAKFVAEAANSMDAIIAELEILREVASHATRLKMLFGYYLGSETEVTMDRDAALKLFYELEKWRKLKVWAEAGSERA